MSAKHVVFRLSGREGGGRGGLEGDGLQCLPYHNGPTMDMVTNSGRPHPCISYSIVASKLTINYSSMMLLCFTFLTSSGNTLRWRKMKRTRTCSHQLYLKARGAESHQKLWKKWVVIPTLWKFIKICTQVVSESIVVSKHPVYMQWPQTSLPIISVPTFKYRHCDRWTDILFVPAYK